MIRSFNNSSNQGTLDGIEQIRQGILSVQSLHQIALECRDTGETAAVLTPPGTSKTTSCTKYVNTEAWRYYAGFVVWLAPSWDAAREVQLRIGANLKVAMYPERPRQNCGVLDKNMASHEERGLSTIARTTICPSCQHFSKCKYAVHDTKTFGVDADVIIACDQRLMKSPMFIKDLVELRQQGAQKSPASGLLEPLVIIDEALSANESFVRYISLDDIKRELQVAISCTTKLGMFFADRIIRFLRIAARGGRPKPINTDIAKAAFHTLADAGILMFGNNYRPCLSQLIGYHCEFCYITSQHVVVQRHPWLPATTIFLGAFLQADFLYRRYCLDYRPRVFGADIACQHSDTRAIFIRSSVGFQSRFDRSRISIVEFVADVIDRQIIEGKRTVVVTKKGQMGSNAKALCDALRLRGHVVRFVSSPVDVASSLGPLDIAMLSYGRPGVNSYEGFDTAITMLAFGVSNEILTENAYPEVSPQNRPKLSIENVNGYRTVRIPRGSYKKDRQYLESVLFRLEADPILQAIHRVRPAIHPRLVIAFYQHKVPNSFVQYEETDSIGEARSVYGLPSFYQRKLSKTKAIVQSGASQGHDPQTIAAAANRSKRTIQRHRKAMGQSRPIGRPRKCDTEA